MATASKGLVIPFVTVCIVSVVVLKQMNPKSRGVLVVELRGVVIVIADEG